MKKLTHQVMRGPSKWSVGDREIMAAFVSRLNECTFCVKVHGAVAARAYGDRTKVDDVLADLGTAAVEAPLHATLVMIGKLTRQQIEDALAICFAFNTTNRLANAFGFFVPSSDAFESGAKYLLKRGYQ
jgi:AhpD family alkylhydroperoxidase